MIDQSHGRMRDVDDPLMPVYAYLGVGEHIPSYEYVDWKHAPAKWKPYHNCDCISLSSTSDTNVSEADPCSPACVGQVLAASYGLTRQRWTSTATYNAVVAGSTMPVLDPTQSAFKQDLLRPVPSGGGLFPGEMYLVMGDEQVLPGGTYHYDALHHALDSIKRGPALATLMDAVAPMAQEVRSPLYALIFSCAFQKNAFKYGEFGYRLQGLDIGIVLAQCLEVLQSLHLQGQVQYQFLDEKLNHLLDLQSAYESAYVVVLVAPEQEPTRQHDQVSSEPVRTWRKPAPRTEGLSQAIDCWPLSAQLHHASLCYDKAAFVSGETIPQLELVGQPVALPQATRLHLSHGSAQRHSARHSFRPGEIRAEALAAILESASRGYISDLMDTTTRLNCQIYCVVHAVTGLAQGAYCYQKSSAHLFLQKAEDMRPSLQQLLAKMGYHNTYHISVYVFIIGNYKDGCSLYGNRWYRMQHMEAGMIIQRIYLASALLGLGCDTSLAYPVAEMDRLLELPAGYSTLAQVMIAPEWVAGQYYESVIGPSA